ncbi:MAG: methyltransferase family protein [Candidatus Heimdallarchaeota archaeon]
MNLNKIVLLNKELGMRVGTKLMVLSLIIYAWVRLAMGASWRVGIDYTTKTNLITTGPFQFSQNPTYLSFQLMFLGSFLICQDISFLGLFLSNFLLLHLQILQEEKYLESRHGDEYRAYYTKVRRYFWKI